MKIGYVTVLDYSVDDINIYKFFLHDIEEMEDYIKSKGHNVKNCSWMISEELKLKIH